VLAEMPRFLTRPTVLGIGEIGLNKNTPNEAKVFQQHVQMAIDTWEATVEATRSASGNTCAMGKHHLILIHTPHLEDKLKGTRMILEMLKDFGSALDPARILIDHVEEHTIKMVKEAGYFAGMTIYPVSKCTPQRAVDMIEMHGSDRLCVNAAADWGISDPLQTHRTMLEAKKRGHPVEMLMQVFYNNPAEFFGQSPRFRLKQLRVSEA
jgi:predicted metal-dependent TIM-barrel fold hydrolase